MGSGKVSGKTHTKQQLDDCKRQLSVEKEPALGRLHVYATV